jgi:hypothetical protein
MQRRHEHEHEIGTGTAGGGVGYLALELRADGRRGWSRSCCGGVGERGMWMREDNSFAVYIYRGII